MQQFSSFNLERYQVSVRPSTYRLFDHILVALALEMDDTEAIVSGTARIRLLLGTPPQPGIVQAVTDSFVIDAVPRIELARIGWYRLQTSGKARWDFGHLLFLHLECNTSGITLEFPLVDEAITSFRVNLGGLTIPGCLPEDFSLSDYFGDASKLED